MISQVLQELNSKIEKVFDVLNKELAQIRTGRANLSIIEHIRVDYYGTATPLTQIASVSIPDARMIVIKPWEKNLLSTIEKSIKDAQIGIQPMTDSEVVRLAIPPLTQERRKEISKSISKLGEETKVSIRHLRRDSREFIENKSKKGEIPKDDSERMLQKIQEVIDKAIEKIDSIISKKQTEILQD